MVLHFICIYVSYSKNKYQNGTILGVNVGATLFTEYTFINDQCVCHNSIACTIKAEIY